MASKSSSDDRSIAELQFIKAKRTEVRLRYALMADAEIARSLPAWRREFLETADKIAPAVLDLQSEARRLGSGSGS